MSELIIETDPLHMIGELVRCKDCKYLNEKGFCEKHSRIKKEDMDFCSWGVKANDN